MSGKRGTEALYQQGEEYQSVRAVPSLRYHCPLAAYARATPCPDGGEGRRERGGRRRRTGTATVDIRP
eukprot:1849748-Rhodomonas_salina.1